MRFVEAKSNIANRMEIFLDKTFLVEIHEHFGSGLEFKTVYSILLAQFRMISMS
jgi:hypothetical protein